MRFDTNMTDVINTVNDAIMPNYGVEIIAANLKINMPDPQSPEHSQSNLSHPNDHKGITTVKDENTGLVRTKALPYTCNPKLHSTTTRKDYLESGIANKPQSLLRKLIKAKHKHDAGQKHDVAHSNEVSIQNSHHNKSLGHLHSDRNDQTSFFTSNQTPVQTSNFEETLEIVESNRTHRPFAFLPSIRVSSQQARKLLYDPRDLQSNRVSTNYMKDAQTSDRLSIRTKLNLSMAVPNHSKLTSPIPSSREILYTKTRKPEHGNSLMQKLRQSLSSMNSGGLDICVDYKNDK